MHQGTLSASDRIRYKKEARVFENLYKISRRIDEDMNGARVSNPKRIILRIWTTLDAYLGITLVSVPRLHGTMSAVLRESSGTACYRSCYSNL